MRNRTRNPNWLQRSPLAAAVGTVLALGTSALAAADPAVVCEASKLSQAAKYASCRLKAESKAAKTGEMPDYSKCSLAKFTDAETKATAKGGACPTDGDQSTVETYLNGCASRVTTWLDEGSGLPDTCASDLDTCEDELATTDADLAACESEAHGQTLQTGQTTCYNSSGTPILCTDTGQDGDLRRGMARSFTDNGDGTITDNRTGLMWEKLDDNNNHGQHLQIGNIHDASAIYTWAMAFQKIGVLNTANFAGYDDWRLPSVTEVQSLLNYSGATPATYPEFHSNCSPGCTTAACSCSASPLWTSTTYVYNPSLVFIVTFSDAWTYPDSKGNSFFARAVRGGA